MQFDNMCYLSSKRKNDSQINYYCKLIIYVLIHPILSLKFINVK